MRPVLLGAGALAAGIVYAGLVAASSVHGARTLATFEIAALLMVAAYGATGCLVAARGAGGAIGWLLLYIALVTAVTHGADAWAQLRLPGTAVAAWLQNWAFYLAYPAAFSALLLVFPTGRPPWRRWTWLLVALPLSAVPRLLLSAFAGDPVAGHMSGQPLLGAGPFPLLPRGFGDEPLGGVVDAASWVLPAAGFTAAGVSLAGRWRAAGAQARRQLSWLLLVAVLAAIAFAVHLATDAAFGAAVPDVGGAALLVLLATGVPGAIGISVHRHGLYAAGRLVDAALVYGALAAILVAVYAASVGALDLLLRRDLQPIAAMAGTGMVAILFAPLRLRLQALVSRFLFGDRGSPYEALAEVATHVAGGVDGAPLLDDVAASVARSLRADYVAITAQSAGAAAPEAHGAFGSPAAEVVRIPLDYHGRRVGFMHVASTLAWPGAGRHRRLLDDLAGQAAAAASAAIQARELQDSRARIVAVRDEERRRLRRDLHDGLGPALAAQTLKAGAARLALASNPAQARGLLREIERDGQATMAEVRRLVHALRPPALDDAGLGGAIRQVAGELLRPPMRLSVDIPDSLPPIPAATEVAALRVAQEALSNVRAHSRATACRVGLSLDGGLRLLVADDGVGFDGGRAPGVGLASIHERANELGGRARVTSRPEAGTVVELWLPLPAAVTP